MRLPNTLDRLVSEISKLPGVGIKSARRIAFHLATKDPKLMESLGDALKASRGSLSPCKTCFALTDSDDCPLCEGDRENDKICVVEDAQNIFSIENGGIYRGLYHVLQGVLSPIRGVHPEHLRIKELEARVEGGACSELILALNPTLEGEATCHYITDLLQAKVPKITRLAVGIPSGGDMEYSDVKTLSQAFTHRMPFTI